MVICIKCKLRTFYLSLITYSELIFRIIITMQPLANQIRPASLDEFVGQKHLVGEGKPLRLAIEQGHVFSFVLWGTPGTGKTTLARIYANAINAEFYELSAVSAGKEDIRKILRGQNAGILPASDSQAGSLRSDGQAFVENEIF